MKLYADLPARRARQILGDLLALAWVVGCVAVGRLVHAAVAALAAPARSIAATGTSLSTSMSQAAQEVARVPAVGDSLRRPFDQAATATSGLVGTGTTLAADIDRMALVLGIVTATLPALIVLAWWLGLRVRFVRRAAAAQRFIDADADLDLFALRALATQPMPRIAAISADPAGAWRRGDPEVVRALAVLELRTVGLRPPALGRGSDGHGRDGRGRDGRGPAYPPLSQE